jgi:hypothetical protein
MTPVIFAAKEAKESPEKFAAAKEKLLIQTQQFWKIMIIILTMNVLLNFSPTIFLLRNQF